MRGRCYARPDKEHTSTRTATNPEADELLSCLPDEQPTKSRWPGVDVDERPDERRGEHCMLVHLERPQARMMALPSRTT